MAETLSKLMSSTKIVEHGSNSKDPRAVGLLVRLSMISGTAQQVGSLFIWNVFSQKLVLISIMFRQFFPIQIREEQPALVRGKLFTARKMGFPEVIFPNDVRNDLYINMTRGEFYRSGSKGSDKNIEVTVSVHNSNGKIIPGVISGGAGSIPKDQYKSVVYYHDDKPKWNEYFKVALPMNIEEFSGAHIRFTFKHR